MKKTFSGYYSPSKEELSKLWNDCLFIFDANVLLNLYRYSASTAHELIGILKKISERIWVPNQAALEYHKDRLNVISQQSEAYDRIQGWLENASNKLENELRAYTRHPLIDVEKIIKEIMRHFDNIKTELSENRKNHPDLFHTDTLRDTITSLFDGKVGPPYDEERMEEIYKKGEKRYKHSIPPGFSDAKKEGIEKYGDLVLWFQIIDKAIEIKKPIIFITDNRKEDWWNKFKEETIGPHPKLVEEIKSKAEVSFYMYHTEPFMKYVQDYLKQKVKQKAIEEVREVQKSLDEQNSYQRYLLAAMRDDLSRRPRTLEEMLSAAWRDNISRRPRTLKEMLSAARDNISRRPRTLEEMLSAARDNIPEELVKAIDIFGKEQEDINKKENNNLDSEPKKESE